MATKKAAQSEPKGYADAMREVEAILSELDSNSVDVDVLATKVERASFLINWCSDRITSAQMTVDSLVADLAEYVVEDDENDEDDEEEDEEEDDDDFDDDDD
jgi:exodeoxyribonuclease VII small subunit